MMKDSFSMSQGTDICSECGLPDAEEVCDECDAFVCEDCLQEVGASVFCSSVCVDDYYS